MTDVATAAAVSSGILLALSGGLFCDASPCQRLPPNLLPMKIILLRIMAVIFVSLPLMAVDTAPVPPAAPATRKPGEYAFTADSLPQPGVPKGRLEGPFEFQSKILAGTVRRYWLYVPAQYTADKPACLLVFQDGQRATKPDGDLRIPQVLENLIAEQ